ncbi:hypothetical protein R1flu_004579 [Riccia fluitans]|uniref:Uncharacterized protein n=1 Tax=Riccia fluitans TaxID=41844 RepID=A0ABD1YRJ1_9MARC
MEWLKEGWATEWMSSQPWPESVTGEELVKRLQTVEKVVKTPCGSDRKANVKLYLQEVTFALFAAGKWEQENGKFNEKEVQVIFTSLYGADVSKHLEAYLQLPESADETEINDLALLASAFLVDNCKLVMKSLAETNKADARKVSHAIHLLRTLCVATDKRSAYHGQLADAPLPSWLPAHPFRTFTNASYSTAKPQVEESYRIERSTSSTQTQLEVLPIRDDEGKSQKLGVDTKPKKYLRAKLLLEYFGNGYSMPGYQLLVSLIYASVTQKLSLETGEVILRFVSIAIEFLKDHKKNVFLAPCIDMLRYVYACYATRGLDKMSLATVTMIIGHLRIIFRSLLPVETAEYVINDMHRRQRDQIMQFIHPQSATQSSIRYS